jgi:hypothetical protein
MHQHRTSHARHLDTSHTLERIYHRFTSKWDCPTSCNALFGVSCCSAFMDAVSPLSSHREAVLAGTSRLWWSSRSRPESPPTASSWLASPKEEVNAPSSEGQCIRQTTYVCDATLASAALSPLISPLSSIPSPDSLP